eukprot:Protomagalhaensia_sp_Gyna_25__1509@NODE_1773_length_1546_cov_1552_435965_g1453_i0_p1_GENE_NODE_1773_length_1546_cov_1552_435965_g1453_i0NODE_1773_length_1546_cov_1552_435965_g1453_i0_p1_ORF_typecomplete_len187_score39_86Aminotran_3/PF00202_21/2_5e59_NODE_1773_length_1546_cov_1552_435965_g1453_i07521312
MMAIQTGLGRTGKMLAADWFELKPDVLLLGKALSGGAMPVSAVLCSDEIMLTIKPGQHGSTYGGNPLACVVAMEALSVLQEEKLAENSQKMGEVFRSKMNALKEQYPRLISTVRGRGLLNAVVINQPVDSPMAWNMCVEMAHNGILAKPTHGNIIRFAPPLVITEEEMNEACSRIEKSLIKFATEV